MSKRTIPDDPIVYTTNSFLRKLYASPPELLRKALLSVDEFAAVNNALLVLSDGQADLLPAVSGHVWRTLAADLAHELVDTGAMPADVMQRIRDTADLVTVRGGVMETVAAAEAELVARRDDVVRENADDIRGVLHRELHGLVATVKSLGLPDEITTSADAIEDGLGEKWTEATKLGKLYDELRDGQRKVDSALTSTLPTRYKLACRASGWVDHLPGVGLALTGGYVIDTETTRSYKPVIPADATAGGLTELRFYGTSGLVPWVPTPGDLAAEDARLNDAHADAHRARLNHLHGDDLAPGSMPDEWATTSVRVR